MSLYKQTKDQLIRFLLGKHSIPTGLFELDRYFRYNGPITFKYELQEDGSIIAISDNFRHGSIITRADKKEDLDEKIKDAILTAFEVPSSYAKEAGVHRVGNGEYAFA
ncbi:MAG: hypothetical protein PHS79_00575 [Patescibacteria group bacterium]|nr:hypothetical protein [Patescibacteria group bacterium]